MLRDFQEAMEGVKKHLFGRTQPNNYLFCSKFMKFNCAIINTLFYILKLGVWGLGFGTELIGLL